MKSPLRALGEDPLSAVKGIVPNGRGVVVDDLTVLVKIALGVVATQLAGGWARVRAEVAADDIHIEAPTLVVTTEGTHDGKDLPVGGGIREGVGGVGGGRERAVFMVVDGAPIKASGPFPLPPLKPHTILTQDFLVACYPDETEVVLSARVVCDKTTLQAQPHGQAAHRNAPAQSADATITLKPAPPMSFSCAISTHVNAFPMLPPAPPPKPKQVGDGPRDAEAVRVPAGETLVLRAKVKNVSLCELELVSFAFDAAPSAPVGAHSLACRAAAHPMPCTLSEQEVFCFVATAKVERGEYTGPLGTLRLAWRQAGLPPAAPGEEAALVSEAVFALPWVAAVPSPCTATLAVPPHAVCGEAFTLGLSIVNPTHLPEHVTVEVLDDASFVFGGYRKAKQHIMPHGRGSMAWSVVPVQSSGHVPRIRIQSHRTKAVLSLAPWIYVKPRADGTAREGAGGGSPWLEEASPGGSDVPPPTPTLGHGGERPLIDI